MFSVSQAACVPLGSVCLCASSSLQVLSALLLQPAHYCCLAAPTPAAENASGQRCWCWSLDPAKKPPAHACARPQACVAGPPCAPGAGQQSGFSFVAMWTDCEPYRLGLCFRSMLRTPLKVHTVSGVWPCHCGVMQRVCGGDQDCCFHAATHLGLPQELP